MTPDVAGYGRAVSDLRAASAGLYSGPAIDQEALAKAAGTTKGLRTDALRNTAQAMVGGSSTAFVTDKFWGSLIKILAQIATSFIASGLFSLAERWLGGSDDADNIQMQSHQASDAIDCVDQEATTNIATVISQLTAMIGQLVATLAGIDKKENPEAFAECVSAGAQAIDSAGKTIKQTCENRDKAIEQCFSTLTHRTEEKCSVQDPPPPPACTGGASGGAPVPAPATQPAGVVAPPAPPAAGGRSGGGGGATDILGAVGSLISGLCKDSTTTEATTEAATQTTTETVEKTCEKANEKNTRVATTTSVTETCLEKEESEVVVADCKPETKSCEQTCIASGVIGAVGLGIAVLGIGALIHCITESMGAFECVPPPPTPDVPPPPAPAPPPVIDNVPEPPPPPKQIPGMVPAAAPVPPPPAPEPPAPAPLSSHINVKKAGSW
ncbi:hypothetical protein NY035_03085 [Corynebacterium diphtheriae bv. mitis]|uniref:hypothetical protein n=1 Tax=Corynebacterium diphtheriae TaxID=1717 RepID=UPI0018CAE894|nr:hypothetical protein [Corynebacterium diphtheriae]MBG9358167.1 hypothetical protein [Corynebacterium diphtheriae bv. mitis]MBG9360317.1 hypothetical protein [Corynebacterium diphtheriae bv. mitis]MBG9362482.1 hypothetical protein [Corynebacterium diphtheriae bv. mitis]MBG9364649.1 hypothetical protein [Corynebacterium diphtheriae bv. mitis]UWE84505.1 hypothetical protein NY053_03800 [Corynebacterium diphtheriae bv. mitis]